MPSSPSCWTTAWMQEVEQRRSSCREGWVEENKINWLYPPHPGLLPQGRRSTHLCRYLCLRAKVSTQLFCIFCIAKTMRCNSAKLPLLLDDCMDAGGRATQEQLPRGLVRRIKSTGYIPLISAFSLNGEGAPTCVDTFASGHRYLHNLSTQ